jgi:glutamate carboxypeptidase
MSALDRLRRLVELESPSHDEPRLRTIAGALALDLARLGFDVETRDIPGVGEHVLGRLPGRERLEPVLILGHMDTVHPVGTFDPVFQVRDGRARGPGTFDMKGGLACMLEALARLREDEGPRRPVMVLATCDEETGSESSRALIEELAGGVHAVLVPEPPFPDGRAKTRRKGVAWYRLTVRGRSAHAGLAPGDGVNALVELAHQTLAATALADPGAGTTVSVDRAEGGTASNVVPDRAWAEIDVRFTSLAEAERVDAGLRALEPRLAGATLELGGGMNRPPMERTRGVAALYERARSLAGEDGWELGEGMSGGASDGSITAGLGVATLDGIGPVGDGAHTPGEHVRVDDLPRRVSLYRRLLAAL